MKKRILRVLCCLVLLCALPMMAFAQDVPDLTRTGSVSVTLTHKGEPVTGGSFTLYRVADIAENDGNFFFRLVPALEGYGISLENLNDSRLAQRIADAAEDEGLQGDTLAVEVTGNVTFENLTLGLYLLVQEKACPGYNAVEPFLVAVPNRDKDAYLYDVDASPKVELETAPTTETTGPTEPPTEVTIPGKLPQTGQNNWPVPVMLIAGLLFIACGVLLQLGGRDKDHET